MGKSGEITVDTRAPSDYANCNCQCDSYTWVNSRGIRAGNCKVADRTGSRFCYVSGSALCACRDIAISQSRPSNYNGPLYYSYEACATPARNSYECRNSNPYGGNYGDGDYPYCRATGINNNRPVQPFQPSRPNSPSREGSEGSTLDDILNGRSSNSDDTISF